MIQVKPGQTWRDNDIRANNRLIYIERVDENYAYGHTVGGNRTRIALYRFSSRGMRGYTLHKEAR